MFLLVEGWKKPKFESRGLTVTGVSSVTGVAKISAKFESRGLTVSGVSGVTGVVG